MKVMLLAFVMIGVTAFAADKILHSAGFSAQDQTSGKNVRLD